MYSMYSVRKFTWEGVRLRWIGTLHTVIFNGELEGQEHITLCNSYDLTLSKINFNLVRGPLNWSIPLGYL